jgi:hypothetical protein
LVFLPPRSKKIPIISFVKEIPGALEAAETAKPLPVVKVVLVSVSATIYAARRKC